MITEIDKNTALILIDLQNAIVQLPLQHPVNEVINNAGTLLHAFHKAALPAVIVNVNPTGRWTTTRKDAKQAPVVFTAEQLAITPELSTMPTIYLLPNIPGTPFLKPVCMKYCSSAA